MSGRWAIAGGAIVLLAVIGGIVAVLRTARPVAVVKLEVRSVAEIRFSGTVEASKLVSVRPTTDGLIERMMTDKGEDVFEGELLARIRNPRSEDVERQAEAEVKRLQARVASLEGEVLAARLEASRARSEETRSKAELDLAEKNFAREKQLNEQGAVARIVFEKAEADYNALKAKVEELGRTGAAAEARIAGLTADLDAARKQASAAAERLDVAKADLGAGDVHSSVNGIVIAKNGAPGQPVTKESPPLYQIGVELNDLRVAGTVEEKQAAKIRVGQAAVIQLPDVPNPVMGTVSEVAGERVSIVFARPLPGVKPGMAAQVKIIPAS